MTTKKLEEITRLKASVLHAVFLFTVRFLLPMTSFVPHWLKQLLVHHASTARASDRCTVVNRPSSMSDVDSMPCVGANQDRPSPSANANELNAPPKDTIVIDRFQACFIDCTCQCEVRTDAWTPGCARFSSPRLAKSFLRRARRAARS